MMSGVELCGGIQSVYADKGDLQAQPGTRNLNFLTVTVSISLTVIPAA